MRIIFYFIILFILQANSLSGQEHVLYGKVIDHTGEILPGASIITKDFQFSTTSEPDGSFTIRSKGKVCQEFTVSYLGYQTAYIHLEFPYPADPVVITLQPYLLQLDQITIKDNYVQRRIKENTLSITMASEEYISRHTRGSLMKTLERLPGISAMGIGSGQSKPVIRGMGFNRVVVTENGIKHEAQQWGSDHGLEIDQFGVEEIEVLKGPVSLMYGSDAMAGVINIRSYSIPHKNSISGTAEMLFSGNNNLWGGSLNIQARKTRWYVAGRFSFSDYGDMKVPADTIQIYSYNVALNQGTLTNTAGNEKSFQFNAGYMGTRLQSSFFITQNNSLQGMFAHAHGLEPRRVDTALHFAFHRDKLFPRQDVSHFKAINRTQYYFGEHRTLLELGFQKNLRNEYNNYVSHGYMPALLPEGIDFDKNLERGFEKTVLTGNLKQELSFRNSQYFFGINSEYQNNVIDGFSFIIPDFHQWVYGAFAYNQTRLNEKWNISSGLRYDIGNIAIYKYLDWFQSPVKTGETVQLVRLERAPELKREFQSWSGSAGISYNKNNFSFKTNVGKSFRIPGAKELASNGVNYHHFSFEKGDSTLKAEVSLQLDAAMEWNTSKWALQISPFINYFPNYIYLNPGYEMDIYYGAGNQIFTYRQSKVLRTGGEIQAQYELSKSLKLGATAEYVYAIQLSGEKKGFTLPFSPPLNLLLNLSYNPRGYKYIKEPYAGIDFVWSAAQNNIVPPEQKTPGYTLWNLNMGARFLINKQSLFVYFMVNNVLNTRYLNHTNYYRIISLPEAGRNIGIRFKIPLHKSILSDG